MADFDRMQFRVAGPSDAAAIAALHTDSWRRHYRGAYSDAFLDGDITSDRLAVWTDQLQELDRRRHTVVAEDGDDLVGFAHTIFDDDPQLGALLDNFHVVYGRKRRGIGSRLLALTARAVAQRPVSTGLYLWVLEQNATAQAFYRAHRGQCVGSRQVSPPGGVPGRLHGTPTALCFSWPDPSTLLA